MSLPVANAGSYSNKAYGALPTTQALTGSGTPGTGGTSITAWLWALIDKPTGSAASLSSTSVQNPTLNGIDLPGTYVLKLVVTDNLGAVSETDTMDCPDSAIATVTVTTEFAALEVPGYWQRNWKDQLTGWAEAIDDLKAATAVATTTSEGIVALSETPVDAAAPVAVTQDRVYLVGRVTGKIAATTMSGAPAQSILQFPIPEEINAVGWSYALANGGHSARSNYVFDLYHQSNAEFVANTFNAGDKISTVTVAAPGTSHIPMNGGASSFDRAMVARDVLSLVVSSAPGSSGDQAEDMTVTIILKRKW